MYSPSSSQVESGLTPLLSVSLENLFGWPREQRHVFGRQMFLLYAILKRKKQLRKLFFNRKLMLQLFRHSGSKLCRISRFSSHDSIASENDTNHHVRYFAPLFRVLKGRREGGGELGGRVVRCCQITRSRCPFQSFLDRTLTVLSPLDDVTTGIGNSYFLSIQPLPHPPRSSSTCINYSETRLIRKLSVRVIAVPVLSGLSLEKMYKIFQRRDKRNLCASHRSPITQGQTFVTLTMKRYKKCFRQLLLWLVPFYRRAVLSICIRMLQILSVNSSVSFIIAGRKILERAVKSVMQV